MKRYFWVIFLFLMIAGEFLFLHYAFPNVLHKNLLLILAAHFLIFLIIAIVDSHLLLVMTFAFLPFYQYKNLNFEIGFVNFSIFSLGIICLSAYLLFLFILGKMKYKTNKLDILIILLSIIYAISMTGSEDIIKSGFIFFHTFFIPVATFFILKAMIDTVEKYDAIFYVLATSVTFIALVGIIQFIRTGGRLEVFDMPGIGTALLFIYIAYNLMYSKHFKRGKFYYPILLISLSAAFLSFTRMVLLLLLISPFMITLFKKGYVRSVFIISLAFTLIMSLFTPLLFSGLEKELREKAPIESSEVGTIKRITSLDYYIFSFKKRLLSHKFGLSKITEKPLFGHGPEAIASSAWHNIYVEILYWTGLLGLIFFILIFLYPLWVDLNSISLPNIYQVHLYMLFSLLINGLTNGYHGLAPLMIFITIGMCEVLKNLPSKKNISAEVIMKNT